MLDDDDDNHHGNDIPANTVNTSAEQGMVDDEGTSDAQQVANINDNPIEDDQLSVDQVKTTGDHETPLLIIGGDKFDQDNFNCHDNRSNEDIPSVHRADQPEDPSVDMEDTPTDVTEEIFHNSVDKLFNNISVDELFDDNV